MKRLLMLCAGALAASSMIYAEQGITLTTGVEVGSEIKFLVNSKSAIQPIIVDFGDGESDYFTIDPNQMESNRWISGTVKGKTMRISGNVTEFACEGQGLTGVSVEGMTSLDKLQLANNEISDFEFVDATPVRILDLSHNKLENYVSWNANLTFDKAGETLYDLNISYNDDIRCLNMSTLRSLVYLTANNCPQLGSIFICAPEESHPNLRSINLNDCDLAHFYPVSLPELRTLELANNNLVSGSYDTDPFVLGDYPNLTSLNLAGNWGISELDVTECPLLQQLHISDCRISAIDLSQNPELITLSASNNKISSLDLGNNRELNYLYLANNPIKSIDFTKMLKVQSVDISGTQISRVDLFYCYYLKSFNASNTQLEFVDFNAQQPERMQLLDLRDCPNFTPMSMAYTVKTLPVARTTQSTNTTLFLSGSHPEIADIAYVTGTDMHWICDSEGDGSADYPIINVNIQDAELSVDQKWGSLERLYPYGGMSLDYDLTVHSTEGGRFILAQWEPEWFQSVTSVITNMRCGVPVYVYPYPEAGKQFRSVTVNGKEIFSNWFMVDDTSADIRVNFEDKESCATFTTESGRSLSFCVATTTNGGTVEIDWGTGVRTPYTNISAYSPGMYDVVGTRIEGKAASSTISIYGDIAALDISCYGDVGEEMFGLPNNHISSVDVTECPALKLLNLYWNPIKELDLSNNPLLEMLDFSYTAVSHVDISANPALIQLSGYANSDEIGDSFAQIDAIDLTGHAALQEVDLHNQRLTAIDVTGAPMLTSLNVTNNNIGALNLSNNPNLIRLRASNNALTSLDLSANTALNEVILDSNNLTAIDLSNNTALEELSVANNAIKSLDTHMLPELGKLYINGNGLTAEQLNDIYYLLPERKHHSSDDDQMAIKFNLIANQASDREENDGNGADGSIAVIRQWTPNPNGTNSGSATSYLDILPAANGSVVITDKEGTVYTSGSKVKKYTSLTISATPAEGYKFDGFRLNGDELTEGTSMLMPGIYTIFEPVFTTGAGIDEVNTDAAVSITVDASGNIIVNGPAADVTVYTIDGRVATQTYITGGNAVIDTLGSGTYIVRVSGTGVSEVKTIVK